MGLLQKFTKKLSITSLPLRIQKIHLLWPLGKNKFFIQYGFCSKNKFLIYYGSSYQNPIFFFLIMPSNKNLQRFSSQMDTRAKFQIITFSIDLPTKTH